MDYITAYAIYMTVAILVVGLWATRVPHEDVGIVFVLALIWPFTIGAIIGFVILNATGWDMEVAKGTKMFGVRRPGNPKIKGFAVTVFGNELQFFKASK